MDQLDQEKKTWRCFHCDEAFNTRETAAEHFGLGDYEDEPPLCIEAATTDLRKLVLTNREMWAELQKAHGENEELEDHLENFRYVARKLTKKPDATSHDLEHEWDFIEGRVIATDLRVALASEAERIRICAYLGFDTTYSEDFCVRCSHCPSNCVCTDPVYMAGWTPGDTLKALKVALFTEGQS